jgi:hypothetical protein
VTIKAGSFYLVCPDCWEHTRPSIWEDGTEYRKGYFDEIDEGEAGDEAIVYEIGDNEDWACDDWGLLCNQCSSRLSVPDFMSAEYV